MAVSVPVATNRVTTISFPSPIDAIDGAGITVDGKTPGLFQLAHAKGSAFLSVRAIFPKASANLNIRWNDHTYVFELIESNAPVLSLNMAALPTPEETGAGRAPEVSPLKLLSLLDKAKAFPLLKAQQPESVADVGFTTYDGKPLVSDFNDYQIQIEAAFRFNAEDTLVFRVAITNETDAPLIYQPDSFTLRAGNRLYPQSISDASGTVPPKGRSIVYFAVTGTPDGGRNNLSLKNQFTVLVNRLSPPATAAARCHDHQCPRSSHPFTKKPAMKPRDFLNFLKTKSGKLVVFGAVFAGGLIIFSALRQHHTPSEVAATPLATNSVSGKPEVVQTIVRPMQPFNPPQPKSASTPPIPASGMTNSAIYQSFTATAAKCSAASNRIAHPHQPVCRQRGGRCPSEKIERGLCSIRTIDPL